MKQIPKKENIYQPHLGVSIHGGTQQWMVDSMENPKQKWMITYQPLMVAMVYSLGVLLQQSLRRAAEPRLATLGRGAAQKPCRGFFSALLERWVMLSLDIMCV